jgi:hypothetical protein
VGFAGVGLVDVVFDLAFVVGFGLGIELDTWEGFGVENGVSSMPIFLYTELEL